MNAQKGNRKTVFKHECERGENNHGFDRID